MLISLNFTDVGSELSRSTVDLKISKIVGGKKIALPDESDPSPHPTVV